MFKPPKLSATDIYKGAMVALMLVFGILFIKLIMAMVSISPLALLVKIGASFVAFGLVWYISAVFINRKRMR